MINKNINYKKKWLSSNLKHDDNIKKLNSPGISKATIVEVEFSNKWLTFVSYYKSPLR